jgi:hypothetical protein
MFSLRQKMSADFANGELPAHANTAPHPDLTDSCGNSASAMMIFHRIIRP